MVSATHECSFLFTWLALSMMYGPCGISQNLESPGSEFPPRACKIFGYSDLYSKHVEPRVDSLFMRGSGALEKSRAKFHGENPANDSSTRQPGNTCKKPALTTAHGRASRSILGGTWYGGRWFTEQMFQSSVRNQPAMARPLATSVARGQEMHAGSRIKVMTYNVGGIATDSYGTFANWLRRYTGDLAKRTRAFIRQLAYSYMY